MSFSKNQSLLKTDARASKCLATAIALALLFAGKQSGEVENQTRIQTCRHDAKQVYIPSGEFWMGSTKQEREYAYRLDKEVTRSYGWYERETRRKAKTSAFCIDRHPVTNSEYKSFIDDTRHTAPFISADAYQQQGFLAHPYEKVNEFLWRKRSFPPWRQNHPVVLVSLDDSRSYCAWMSKKTSRKYRLPTEIEWEKAARGTDGRIFPWGDQWNPNYLNSGERFHSTTSVTRFPQGRVLTAFTT